VTGLVSLSGFVPDPGSSLVADVSQFICSAMAFSDKSIRTEIRNIHRPVAY
jgi:hypothetical protein